MSTKDGALVCRPDITLDGNTNIAQDKALRGRESVQVCVQPEMSSFVPLDYTGLESTMASGAATLQPPRCLATPPVARTAGQRRHQSRT